MTPTLKSRILEKAKFDNSGSSERSKWAIEYADEFLGSKGKSCVPTTELYAGMINENARLMPLITQLADKLEECRGAMKWMSESDLTPKEESNIEWLKLFKSEVRIKCKSTLASLAAWEKELGEK